ncbi:MAG: hypothetical protein QXR63_00015 [Candidatus Bathyarchaeia archaeon]
MQPLSLQEVFENTIKKASVIPPPLHVKDPQAATFSVDLAKMTVYAPPYWSSITHKEELFMHEIKHASRDGLPYTYKDALLHEITLISNLGKSKATVKNALNVVYDVIVDMQVKKERLDAKGMCVEWLNRFPVKEEGTSYHLLQIIYKDFFGVPLKETTYEKEIRLNRDFNQLKSLLKMLATKKYGDNDVVEMIVKAATLVMQLSKCNEMSAQSKGYGDQSFYDINDPEVKNTAIAIGLSKGLSVGDIADFLEEDIDKVKEAIEKAAKDNVRQSLWRNIKGFKDLIGAKSYLDLKEPCSRRWRPYSKRIDENSIMKAPDDPWRWREPIVDTILSIEQPGSKGGFSKIVLLVDYSGSTAEIYNKQPILHYIKEAAYLLIAYAKTYNLPVLTIAFNDAACTICKESKDYLEHGVSVFKLSPFGGTNLSCAAALVSKKAKNALIAVITDGFVQEHDVVSLKENAKANSVIALVINPDPKTTVIAKNPDKAIKIFVAKPDDAGKLFVETLFSQQR